MKLELHHFVALPEEGSRSAQLNATPNILKPGVPGRPEQSSRPPNPSHVERATTARLSGSQESNSITRPADLRSELLSQGVDRLRPLQYQQQSVLRANETGFHPWGQIKTALIEKVAPRLTEWVRSVFESSHPATSQQLVGSEIGLPKSVAFSGDLTANTLASSKGEFATRTIAASHLSSSPVEFLGTAQTGSPSDAIASGLLSTHHEDLATGRQGSQPYPLSGQMTFAHLREYVQQREKQEGSPLRRWSSSVEQDIEPILFYSLRGHAPGDFMNQSSSESLGHLLRSVFTSLLRYLGGSNPLTPAAEAPPDF